ISVATSDKLQDRSKDDLEVQQHTPIVNIPDIMVDAFLHALQCWSLASATFDLGPAGDARLHVVAKSVTADQLLIIIIVGRGMRPGPHNRHLTLQHVEKLRQFVNARLSEPCADIRYSRIASYRLLYRRAVIESGHSTKFEDLELLAVEP